MELPPLDIDAFNKWKGGQAVIKDCDMEEEMKNEAKEHVATGIERSAGAEGVDYQGASKMIKESMDK